VTYKNQAWRQPKKSQLALSQGMLKKGDVVGDADDEVRTNVSQNCITATLSTEEFFLRTQFYSSLLISAERCEGGDRK
jgi:hypothetical protein